MGDLNRWLGVIKLKEIIERYCEYFKDADGDEFKLKLLWWKMLKELSTKSAFAKYKESYSMFSMVWREAQDYIDANDCEFYSCKYRYNARYLFEVLDAYITLFESDYLQFLSMASEGLVEDDKERDN